VGTDEERRFRVERQRTLFRLGIIVLAIIFAMYFLVAPIAQAIGYNLALPEFKLALTLYVFIFGAPVLGYRRPEIMTVLRVVFPWLPSPPAPDYSQHKGDGDDG
jgi:hypothetical protein